MHRGCLQFSDSQDSLGVTTPLHQQSGPGTVSVWGLHWPCLPASRCDRGLPPSFPVPLLGERVCWRRGRTLSRKHHRSLCSGQFPSEFRPQCLRMLVRCCTGSLLSFIVTWSDMAVRAVGGHVHSRGQMQRITCSPAPRHQDTGPRGA